MDRITIIGGGLAGSEAAWQAAQAGIPVVLCEMRPAVQTGAHKTDKFAELVCSNSLGSKLVDRASGLLKEELRRLNSMLIYCAEQVAVPAGGALAVDRESFAEVVTARLQSHPNIVINRQEISDLPEGIVIIASGPLTSPGLSKTVRELIGRENLYFYDAIAPIVQQDSINMEIAFWASRYKRGEQESGDYINCPLNQDEYYHFVDELRSAERVDLAKFEKRVEIGVSGGANKYFESCLPIEVIARRGRESLAYGPMRPVGLVDPRTGRRPYAIVQLRQDDLAGRLYNLVGFQTNLKYAEQKRIFRMIPGLEEVEFIRYGQMHRNTFINSPGNLASSLQFKKNKNIFFAGQITGVEGYVGSIATGLLAGLNASRFVKGESLLVLPRETMLGSLCYYIVNASARDFQPMKANFGIMPPLNLMLKGKRDRAMAYSSRSLKTLAKFTEKE